MSVLTWKNVDAPTVVTSRGMFAAGTLFNTGFDKLGDVLKDQQKVVTDNWKVGADNNTAKVLADINQYESPEAYQAALKAGTIQSLLGNMGTQVDQSAVRTAMDGRLALLQNRALADIKYNDAQLEQRDAPAMSQVEAFMANGEVTEAKDLLATLDPKNQGKAAKYIAETEYRDSQRGRDIVGFEQKLRKAAQDDELFPLDKAAKQADIGYKKALTEDALARAEESRKAKDTSKVGAKLNDAYIEELIKSGSFNGGTLDNKEGMDNFIGWVNKNVENKSEKSDIIYNMSKLAKKGIQGKDENGNPIRLPLPVSSAILAVGSATPGIDVIFPFWSRRGDDARNIYTQYMKDNAKSILKEHFAIEDAKGNKFSALNKEWDTLTPNEDSDVDNREHPKINDPIWMTQQREKARRNNAKLAEDVKRRINITE